MAEMLGFGLSPENTTPSSAVEPSENDDEVLTVIVHVLDQRVHCFLPTFLPTRF